MGKARPLEESTSWVRSAAGLYVPPPSAQEHVERALFSVKVVGFTNERDSLKGEQQGAPVAARPVVAA